MKGISPKRSDPREGGFMLKSPYGFDSSLQKLIHRSACALVFAAAAPVAALVIQLQAFGVNQVRKLGGRAGGVREASHTAGS